jgi:hypothetical protein
LQAFIGFFVAEVPAALLMSVNAMSLLALDLDLLLGLVF